MTALARPVLTTAAPRRGFRAGGVPRSALALFLLPFFVPFLLFFIAPICYAIVQSLLRVQRSEGMFGQVHLVFGGLTQYAEVLADREFWAALGRTALFGMVQVPVMLGLALVLALLLDSGLVRHTAFFRLAPFVPYAVPGLIATIIWSFFYHPQLSPIVGLLRDVGINADFFAPSAILWSIGNITTWMWTGYNMIVILASLQAIPGEIYEAARLDGASDRRIAWSIKIPLVRPAIIMTGIFSIIGTTQLYTEPTVLQSISPSISSTFTPNMMAYSFAAGNNYPKAAALSVLIALIAFVLSFLVLKIAQRRSVQ